MDRDINPVWASLTKYVPPGKVRLQYVFLYKNQISRNIMMLFRDYCHNEKVFFSFFVKFVLAKFKWDGVQ